MEDVLSQKNKTKQNKTHKLTNKQTKSVAQSRKVSGADPGGNGWLATPLLPSKICVCIIQNTEAEAEAVSLRAALY